MKHAPDDLLLKQLSLVKEQRSRVRDLLGFRRSHQVPREYSDPAQAFVGKIAADDIRRDLEERFSELRHSLKCRRIDLTVTDPSAGVGAIATPWFEYRVTASLDPERLTQVLIRREVTEFHETKKLKWSGFSAAFGSLFDTVEFRPDDPIDLTELVDWLEERSNPQVRLEYDSGLTQCRLVIEGVKGTLQVTSQSIALSVGRSCSPEQLLEAFALFRDQLPSIGAE